jgi:hypothetical protein
VQNRGVTKVVPNRSVQESRTIERDSRVCEGIDSPIQLPSRAEHVELGSNPRGPSCKAKYFLVTDSELSRAIERWEEPLLGEVTEPETMPPTSDGSAMLGASASGMRDRVPFA